MKPLSKIASECNIHPHTVRTSMLKLGIVATMIKRVRYITKEQEDLIHENLYFESKINEVIFESSINK